MTDIDITLNAWEQNYVPVLAVQGESKGRTINAALVDRTGQTDGTFNAESIDRPIDLTGTTVRLYCKKPDGTQTLSDGTITDAANGKASFVLPQQATAAVGSVSAQIYITKPDNSVLKVIGLTLVVQESDLESIESSNEFDSLVKALNGVEKVSADAKTAVDNANTAISTVTANEDTRQGNESARQANETTRQSQESARQSNESSRKAAETSRAGAETTRESNESARQSSEQARTSAEESRVTAENKRQTDTEAAISSADTAANSANSAASAANTAADNANHVPQYGDNGNWESWNGTAYADAGKPWKGEKGDTGEKGDKGDQGDPFEYGESYDTLSALEAAYPSGDTKGHLVGTVAYIWDGSAWKNTGTDLSEYQKTADADSKYVPQTRTVNGKALSDDVTLAASDVSAAPSSHPGETISTEAGVHGIRWYGGKLQAKDSAGNWSEVAAGSLNFSGNLIISVTAEDGGSISGTRVRVRNEQLGANYVQPLDALGQTTFRLLDNHTYYVVLLDYPSKYYGAAATITIAGGETQELTLTLKTEPDVVGWRINKATGAVEYTNGAKNFEPMSVAGGTLNAGSWEQHWATDVKPCLLKNMVVQYYLKKTGVFLYDYEHQANGTSSDIRSGDDGDVMNEIPLMYYKFWDSTDPDGTAWNNFALAKEPQDDSWCCNAFLSRSGVPQSTMYIPAYKGSIYNNKLRSLCGVVPTASQTIGTFRTAANANGTGYEIRDIMKDRFLVALFILFFKSLDGQATLGNGAIEGGPVASGTLNDKPLFWGVPSSNNGLKFMGMEFFWGNMFEWLDGIGWISSGNFGYKIRPPYNDDRSGYSDSGIAIPESGYIDTMATANGFGMVPKTTVSDTASSKFHDYYYKNSESYPIIYCGSYWGAGAYYGPFYWHYGAVAATGTYIGASLFATPQ